jgi:hypothetical protein
VPFGEIVNRHSQGSPEHIRIKVVCAPCNNGWMNELEKARKYLAPLIRGEAAVLDAAACEAIARWVFLKTLVLAHAPPPSGAATLNNIYSRQERLTFKTSKRIPPDFEIWIGRGSLTRWQAGVRIGSANLYSDAVKPDEIAPGRPPRNLQTMVWGIGSLVIETLAKAESRLDITWHPMSKGVRLWPSPATEIQWPPPETLTDEDVDQISKAFVEAMQRIKRLPRTP